MKKYFIICIVCTSAFIFPSCHSLIECDSISQRQATFLIDVSDKKLFEDIENDLNANFPTFMDKSGLGNISACQKFTLSFVQLSSKEELDIASASISIDRKGQSTNEERKQSSPQPLVQLIQKKLSDYKQLTDDPQITAGSNICNVLLKAMNQANPDADNYYFLFSDLVENNKQISLYKGIPDDIKIEQVIGKMIEPSVLEKFRLLQKGGFQPKVIIVMKEESSGKINQRVIKEFWIKVFKKLKLNTQFVDNLSNSIKL